MSGTLALIAGLFALMGGCMIVEILSAALFCGARWCS
jgi:hypothetical protein